MTSFSFGFYLGARLALAVWVIVWGFTLETKTMSWPMYLANIAIMTLGGMALGESLAEIQEFFQEKRRQRLQAELESLKLLTVEILTKGKQYGRKAEDQ